MTPIQCAVLAVLFSAGFRTVIRGYMRSSGDHIAILQINQIGALLFLLSVLDFPFTRDFPIEAWFLFAFSGCLWTTACYFDLKSYRHLDVSVSVILTSIRYLVLTTAGFLIFGEHISIKGGVGIVLIVYSIYLIVDFNCINFKKGVYLKLIGMSASTVAMVSDKYLTTLIPVEAVAYGGFLLPTFLAVFLWPKNLKAIPGEIVKTKGIILLSPVGLASAFYLFVRAFGEGELSITVSIERTLAVVVFLFGFVFLHERSNLARRAISSILCVLGAILVATK